jgi:hypothetical protein
MHRTKWTETKSAKTKWITPSVMLHRLLCIFFRVESNQDVISGMEFDNRDILDNPTGKDCQLADSGEDLPVKVTIR